MIPPAKLQPKPEAGRRAKANRLREKATLPPLPPTKSSTVHIRPLTWKAAVWILLRPVGNRAKRKSILFSIGGIKAKMRIPSPKTIFTMACS